MCKKGYEIKLKKCPIKFIKKLTKLYQYNSKLIYLQIQMGQKQRAQDQQKVQKNSQYMTSSQEEVVQEQPHRNFEKRHHQIQVKIKNKKFVIDFPFKPYRLQKKYIKKLVKAAYTKRNALLQSATGTGKSVMILSSLLGFQKEFRIQKILDQQIKQYKKAQKQSKDEPMKKEMQMTQRRESGPDIEDRLFEQDADLQNPYILAEQNIRSELFTEQNTLLDNNRKKKKQKPFPPFPRIIYCSRTHSQLNQVIKEIKKTYYNPRKMKFAPRTELCIKKINRGRQRPINNQQIIEKCEKSVALRRDYEQGKKKKIILRIQNQRQHQKQSQFNRQEQQQQQQLNRQLHFSKQQCRKMCQYYDLSQGKEKTHQLFNAIAGQFYSSKQVRRVAREKNCCPYKIPLFQQNYDIAFMPYDYILNADIMPLCKKHIQGSIIVLDQGHNVGQKATGGNSIKLTFKRIEKACKNIQTFGDKDSGAHKTMDIIRRIAYYKNHSKKRELVQTIEKFSINFRRCFEKHFDEFTYDQQQNLNQGYRIISFSAQHIHKILHYILFYERQQYAYVNKISQIKERNENIIQKKKEIIKKLTAIFSRDAQLTQIMNLMGQLGSKSNGLTTLSFALLRIVKMLYQSLSQQIQQVDKQINHFAIILQAKRQRVYNQKGEQKQDKFKQTQLKWANQPNSKKPVLKYDPNSLSRPQLQLVWQVQIFCNSPAITFQKLQSFNPRSIIITSGTLKPNPAWQKQLKINFRQQIEAKRHVIKPCQVKTFILKQSLTINQKKTILNFSRSSVNQNKAGIFTSLALSIDKLLASIPNGCLIVFKNAKYCLDFQKMVAKLKRENLFLDQRKIFFQQKKGDCQMLLRRYKNQINQNRRAVLCCYNNGRITEGADLAEKLCRAVIMVGIPLPNLKAPKVQLKMEYLQHLKRIDPNNTYLSQDQWYKQRATRLINQAIGRVIRNKDDYGLVFLIDSNFRTRIRQLPDWLKKGQISNLDFQQAIKRADQFYQTIEYEKQRQYLNSQNQEGSSSESSSQSDPGDDPQNNNRLNITRKIESNKKSQQETRNNKKRTSSINKQQKTQKRQASNNLLNQTLTKKSAKRKNINRCNQQKRDKIQEKQQSKQLSNAFKNYHIILVGQFDTAEKSQLRQLIVKLGGKTPKSQPGKKTTHLLAGSYCNFDSQNTVPNTNKYKKAQAMKIPIIEDRDVAQFFLKQTGKSLGELLAWKNEQFSLEHHHESEEDKEGQARKIVKPN